MKKHVLHYYSNVEDNVNNILTGTTRATRSVEDSDPDEFLFKGPTNITETIEDSDSDEFSLS